MRAVEEVLYDVEDAKSFITTIGASSQFGNNPDSGVQFANALVLLKDKEDRVFRSSETVQWLKDNTADLKDGKISVMSPQEGPPTGAPILVKFFGDDLDQLQASAEEAKRIL